MTRPWDQARAASRRPLPRPRTMHPHTVGDLVDWTPELAEEVCRACGHHVCSCVKIGAYSISGDRESAPELQEQLRLGSSVIYLPPGVSLRFAIDHAAASEARTVPDPTADINSWVPQSLDGIADAIRRRYEQPAGQLSPDTEYGVDASKLSADRCSECDCVYCECDD